MLSDVDALTSRMTTCNAGDGDTREAIMPRLMRQRRASASNTPQLHILAQQAPGQRQTVALPSFPPSYQIEARHQRQGSCSRLVTAAALASFVSQRLALESMRPDALGNLARTCTTLIPKSKLSHVAIRKFHSYCEFACSFPFHIAATVWEACHADCTARRYGR